MRHYRFVLNVCELIYHHSVPTEDSGAVRFRDFDRDEATMGELFEQFVRNFYAKEQSHYRISASHVRWDVDEMESTVWRARSVTRHEDRHLLGVSER